VECEGLEERLIGQFGLSLTQAGIKAAELNRHELGEAIFNKLKEDYEGKKRFCRARPCATTSGW